MSKFKVGDLVVKSSGTKWEDGDIFKVIEREAYDEMDCIGYRISKIIALYYESELKLYEEKGDYFKNCKGCKYFDGVECANIVLCTGQNKFKKLEGKVMSKSFKEVIADIKEWDVWENKHYTINLINNGIIIKRKDGKELVGPAVIILTDEVFTLQRKKVSFTEAFKAHEEGKEIESCVDGCKYKKVNGRGDLIKDTYDKEFTTQSNEFDYWFSWEMLRGEWFIND